MGKNHKANNLIDLEVEKESWPLLRHERTWSSIALTWAALTVGIATWSYPIGGAVAYYLNATLGTAAMIAGSLIGIFLIVLATIPPCTKYGIESTVSSTPLFGTKGTLFSIFLQYVSIIGWNCLLLILFGSGVAQILLAMHVIDESQIGFVSTIGTLTAVAISWLLLRGGAAALRKYSFFISLFVLIVSVIMLYLLVTKIGLATIFSSKPMAPSDDQLWNYTVGVEILIASVLSYWPYTGSMVRMVPRAKDSIWPTMLAMGLPIGIISLIGLYAALATGKSDPAQWIVEIGGAGIGIIVLIGLGAANVGTAVTGGYATAIGLRQLSFVQKKISWNQTTLLVFLPVALISIFFPVLFIDKVPVFLAFLGVLFAPVVGIQIVDNLILRRQKLDVQGLFDKSVGSPYYFWGGINPASLVGVVVGVVTYLYLLNPVTYVSSSFFKYTTASIPSLVFAGVSYYLVTKLVNVPAKKGGYYKKAS
ncbi:hypothetical protein EDM56_09680 [Brevibacillus fluminis]|uniref:Nitrate reductase n=1 Tax=Brevibacillus fluminis TaxID=511487 RepID=A0A3M8DPS0_9BACL|nr:cytosine permease [Brevibacillus fluminis]RNB89461.1 hypothetical protein EDM56_09680 [Brevibacillus fluminis]